MSPPLTILAVTNIYPTAAHPTLGVFVEQQIKGLRQIGLNVEVFYVNRAERGVRAYFQMLKPLAAAAQRSSPSLLHVMYGGVMADRVTRWNSRCPTIVTFHGSDLLGENLSGFWRQWISRYGVRCSRRAARAAQGVVVVSRNLKCALPPGLDESKVRVIPCGIDLERFKPMDKRACQRQLGWTERSYHVLFASNSGDPVKRPGLAAAAVKALNNSGAAGELHCLQGVSHRDVPVWINASDALLVTSAQEGSPTVVKEALACGLPVVSVDVGDVAERLDGIDGCHIASPNPQDLAAKLILARQRLAPATAPEQIHELSLRNTALTLERFYHDTLERANPTTARGESPGRDPTPPMAREQSGMNRKRRAF